MHTDFKYQYLLQVFACFPIPMICGFRDLIANIMLSATSQYLMSHCPWSVLIDLKFQVLFKERTTSMVIFTYLLAVYGIYYETMFIDVLGLSMIIYVSQLYFPRCPLIFLIYFCKASFKRISQVLSEHNSCTCCTTTGVGIIG